MASKRDKRYLILVKDRKRGRLWTYNVQTLDRARDCLKMLTYRSDSKTPWNRHMDRYLMANYKKWPASHIARMLRGRGYRSVTKNSVISRYHKLKDLPQWKLNSPNVDDAYRVATDPRRSSSGVIPTSTPPLLAFIRTQPSDQSSSEPERPEVQSAL